MGADAPREKARKSEARVREALTRLTDETLSVTWLLTGGMPLTRELIVTRGWLLNELEARMGPDQFDVWLFADETSADPAPYLA